MMAPNNDLEPTKSQESRRVQAADQRSVALIHGLPECLKMVTSARTQFVADLNAALYDFLVSLDARSQRQ